MDDIYFLPKYLRDSCIRISNARGWGRHDIREVIAHAYKNHIGITSLQVQMNLPSGTCDYYWLCYVSNHWEFGGTWGELCQNSFEAARRWLDAITDELLLQEAQSGFNLLVAADLRAAASITGADHFHATFELDGFRICDKTDRNNEPAIISNPDARRKPYVFDHHLPCQVL